MTTRFFLRAALICLLSLIVTDSISGYKPYFNETDRHDSYSKDSWHRRQMATMLLNSGWKGYIFDNSNPIDILIQAAGNAETDENRLKILRVLRQRDNLPMCIKKDIEQLLPSIERWTNNEILYYYHNPGDFYKSYVIDPNSPLYPIYTFYCARGKVWHQIESAHIFKTSGVAKGYEKEKFLTEIWSEFAITEKAFPRNQIAKMYLGKPLHSKQLIVDDPDAPAWASSVREVIERMNYLCEWWVDNRYDWQGSFRGGEDDDCEMWKDWAPVLIGFDNPKLAVAQRHFVRSLLSQPFLEKGYSSRYIDVEHVAEPTTDTLLPMMLIEPLEKEWQSRILRIFDFIEKDWTGINERGFVQFKSTYFNSEMVETDPRLACDTPWHFACTAPIFLLWQRTGDDRIGEFCKSWLDMWVDATFRSDCQKPLGVVPACVHWPSGNTCDSEYPWYSPRNHPMEYSLYEWPMALTKPLGNLVLGYYMTGDEKYIRPLESMIRIREEYLSNPHNSEISDKGSVAWAGSQNIADACSNAAAKYRYISEDSRFDDYLSAEGNTYMKYSMNTSDSIIFNQLVKDMENIAFSLRYNSEVFTSESRFTDRFFSNRFNMMLPLNSTMSNSFIDSGLIYSVVTGDTGHIHNFQLNSVRWMTEPRNLAVFVKKSGKDSFESLLYSFEDKPRDIKIELYLLESGVYKVNLKYVSGIERQHELEISSRVTDFEFTLQPRDECLLYIKN